MWRIRQYPDIATEGFGNVIENKDQYNSMGQVTKKEISYTSEKHPEQNQSYVEEETVCDSFGNVVSIKDSKGLLSVNAYDEEKNEICSTVSAKGTAYETENRSAHTEDGLKSMELDFYNRCTVTISDNFGNIIVSKDERAGHGQNRIMSMVAVKTRSQKRQKTRRQRKKQATRMSMISMAIQVKWITVSLSTMISVVRS